MRVVADPRSISTPSGYPPHIGGRRVAPSGIKEDDVCPRKGPNFMSTSIAAASGTFKLGGDLEVNRLGYGTMQLTGDGFWGEPDDRDEAIAVLKAAVDAGVNFIDTADSSGPEVAE